MPRIGPDQASLEWIRILAEELDRRTVTISRTQRPPHSRHHLSYDQLDRYYGGHHGERFVATGYRDLFTEVFRFYHENICQVVIDTVEQRLDVDGFRFPGSGAADSQATDPDAWRIWQDNGLDARSQIAHVEAMLHSVAYVLVSPFDTERVGPSGRSPRITIESARRAIVATTSGGLERIVGMKRWRDDVAKRTFVTLYYPDRLEKFQTPVREWANQHGSGINEIADSFERRLVDGETWPLEHKLGAVPLVPLVNHPRLGEGMFAGIEGESDLAHIVPIQDAINFLAINGIVASDKAAFPQKWATGIEIPVDPKTGKPLPQWQPDIDSFISTPVPDAKFGNFDTAELGQYDQAIKGKVAQAAGIAQIPIHNFIPSTGQPASGEAREAEEVGLTKKADRKTRSFGEGWEEVVRLAFRQLGDATRADNTACEAVWKPTSIEPAASKIDALTKERQTLKVPLDVLWERAGYSATQRATFRKMLEAEREWLDTTPVATTQPAALPLPGGQSQPPAPAPAPAAAPPAPGGPAPSSQGNP